MKKIPAIWAVLSGIILSCIFFEAVLHITDQTKYDRFVNDASTGLLTYKPNSTFTESSLCFDNQVSVNNLGFHGPNVTLEKNKTFRIVVVGSSFVEGMQVPVDRMFTSILQEELNKNQKNTHFEVIPIGFSGNGTFLNTLYYLRFGSVLKPDLVINLQTDYDISVEPPLRYDTDGNVILTLPQKELDPKIIALKNLMRDSKLVMNLYNKTILTLSNVKNLISEINPHNKIDSTISSSTADDWQDESKRIELLSNAVKKNGAQFMVVSWATPKASTSTASELSDKLSNLGKEDKFTYLDLSPGIQTLSMETNKIPVFSCDDHWSADGHSFAAESLLSYLLSHKYLLNI